MEEPIKVLVVEDEAISRTLLKRTLDKAGFDVTVAENGKAAMELIRSNFFPILLTDWVMPEMGGLDLCKAVREEVSQGYVYIILLTAKDTKEDIVEGLNSGADDYLTKPFHPAELLARLNTGKRIVRLERSLKAATEEIKLLSVMDALTGCYNRSYLNTNLQKELLRAIRYRHCLSVILCDLDHFKKINDAYGHLAGDHVLKCFVERLRSWTRKDVDWIARFGGEEFLVVLPETDIQKALVVAERLREKTASSPVVTTAGHDIPITASFGVTGFLPDSNRWDITLEMLIGKADEFLYSAKASGRNKVLGGPIA